MQKALKTYLFIELVKIWKSNTTVKWAIDVYIVSLQLEF